MVSEDESWRDAILNWWVVEDLGRRSALPRFAPGWYVARRWRLRISALRAVEVKWRDVVGWWGQDVVAGVPHASVVGEFAAH